MLTDQEENAGGTRALREPVKWEQLQAYEPALRSALLSSDCLLYTHSEARTVVWRVIPLCVHTENQRAGHCLWEENARFPDYSGSKLYPLPPKSQIS